jgi:predicted RND superfamily exporter protein
MCAQCGASARRERSINVQRTLLLVVTVVVSLMWTMGALTLTVGHLTIISIFVASILIGLADNRIIRIIYFLSCYEEERDRGPIFWPDYVDVPSTHTASSTEG